VLLVTHGVSFIIIDVPEWLGGGILALKVVYVRCFSFVCLN
jgi:hypothetical protein